MMRSAERAAEPWRRYLAFGALSAVLLVAAGVTVGFVVAPESAPQSLQAAAEVTSAVVTYEQFDDSRQLAFSVVQGESQEIALPRGGTVTSVTCQLGGTLASGDVPMSIDSTPVVALHTDYPLWRTLAAGDKGDDVKAIQAELARLGYSPGTTGTMDTATVKAVKKLLTDRGFVKPDGSLSLESVMWLPATELTVSDCPLTIAQVVAQGDTAVTTGGGIAALNPAAEFDDLAPGARTVTFDDVTAAVNDDGTVTDPALLATLAGSPDYAFAMLQAAAGSAPQMTLTSTLATTLDVAVVPAGALYGVQGAAGCVATDGTGLPVTIVSSRLGATYVVIDDGSAPATVDLQDASDRTGGVASCS
ncbi:peptidoglycan-binding domain-containing protein [Demequina capsici]|uniref:Peptidoglycan-binding domain-containing protein n=1 Tax=Demequina capsici TaxID=3075620 RepID=A0AA96F5H6_9MICO|nr:peptidoglycan-binding domain-containing protein [Demequina sp. OYTSA14]WNM24198.1 peptidoglycan-binding domain-containing protein [Demequina sp. OYTSA14]